MPSEVKFTCTDANSECCFTENVLLVPKKLFPPSPIAERVEVLFIDVSKPLGKLIIGPGSTSVTVSTMSYEFISVGSSPVKDAFSFILTKM